MKKVLLASSALLAFGAVSAQAAEPLKLSITGFLVDNIGYSSNEGWNAANDTPTNKKQKVVEMDDATLSFIGTTKLDNGISVSANFDFYGTQTAQSRSVNAACGTTQGLAGSQSAGSCNGNSIVKRAYGTVSGAFGAVILGEREDATYIVHTSAPGVGALSNVGDGYWYYFAQSPTNHRGLSLDNDSRWDDRGLKMSYITPAFHGLAAAFSYIPSISARAGSLGSSAYPTSSDFANYVGKGYINNADFGGDAYGGGLAYANTLGGVGVKADATVVQANIVNLRIFQQGLQLSYAGFTFGGSSLIRDVPSNATVNGLTSVSGVGGALTTAGLTAGLTSTTPAAFAQAAAYAGNTFTAGLAYAFGPYSVSGSYFHDNTKSIAGLNGTGKADSTNVYDFGAAYAAGPGVTLRAGVDYVQYRGSNLFNAASGSNGPWLNNNDSWVVATGWKLDF